MIMQNVSNIHHNIWSIKEIHGDIDLSVRYQNKADACCFSAQFRNLIHTQIVSWNMYKNILQSKCWRRAWRCNFHWKRSYIISIPESLSEQTGCLKYFSWCSEYPFSGFLWTWCTFFLPSYLEKNTTFIYRETGFSLSLSNCSGTQSDSTRFFPKVSFGGTALKLLCGSLAERILGLLPCFRQYLF